MNLIPIGPLFHTLTVKDYCAVLQSFAHEDDVCDQKESESHEVHIIPNVWVSGQAGIYMPAAPSWEMFQAVGSAPPRSSKVKVLKEHAAQHKRKIEKDHLVLTMMQELLH